MPHVRSAAKDARIIIIALLAAGLGGWFLYSGRVTSSGIQSDPQPQPTQSGGSETTDISSVIGRGINLECDVRPPDGGSALTGKLWTSNNKGRSTITSSASGEINAIYMDGVAYVWVSGGQVKTGFRIDPSDDAALTAEQRQQADKLRSDMLFDCRTWNPQRSVFEIPADVSFR